MIIDEGLLRFEFGKRWNVVKLDDHPDYRKRLGKMGGAKAVDFLGILDRESLYFIEAKDFRGHRIENKERLQTGELPDEIGQKIRDSIACIIGAYRTASSSEDWQQFASLLHDKQKQVFVVIWLEQDLPTHPKPLRKALALTDINTFKRKLAWLTSRVVVASVHESTIPDLQVQYRKQTV